MLARAAVIVAAGLVAYGNALTNPFILDDRNAVVSNQTIRTVWPLAIPLTPPRETPVAGRPLVNLTLAINYALGGLDVRGYHVGNLAIHLAAALVLFGVVRRTLSLPPLAERYGRHAPNVAWAAALLWAVHPLNSEVVDYVSQRTESLMGLCYLLTLYCAIRAFEQPRRRRWPVAAAVACAAGMASKESMVTAPLVVALYDRIYLFASLRQALAARRHLYAGLAATWVVLAVLMWSVPRTSIGFGAGISPWVYALNQLEIVPRYLWLAIWPRALIVDYGLPRPLGPGDVVLPALVLTIPIAATLVALVRWPRIGFLGAWVFITLAPTSTIVPIATEVGAERRMYLPLAGLMTLVVTGAYLAARARSPVAVPSAPRRGSRPAPVKARPARLGVALTVFAAVLLIAGTVARNREYRSQLDVGRTVVERRPHGRAHMIVATELIARGDTAQAMDHLRASARDYPPAHYGLGTELFAAGRPREAIEHLEEFIRARPQDPAVAPARELMGRAFLMLDQLDAAEDQFELVLKQSPDYHLVHAFLGDLRLRQGRAEEAVTHYQTVLQRSPADSHVLSNLGLALARAGRVAEAIAAWRRAVELDSHNPVLRSLLGRALGSQGHYAEAAVQFRALVALAPGDEQARRDLAAAERLAGERPASN